MERKLKDSGIPWIGQIPEHWEILRFKTRFSTRKGLTITKADLAETGIPVISYGQIHSKDNCGTKVVPSLLRYVPSKYVKSDCGALVKKGNFIFADTSEDIAGCGNCAYIDQEMQIFAGYHSIIACNDHNNKYFAYLFLTDAWRSQIRSLVSGIKVFSISQAILANTMLLIPPVAEQEQIAVYLDKKCGEIDELIEVEQQMISDLEAYRQAVITEAVTHGLNPNVEYKDSEVYWIPQIPKGWKSMRFKSNFSTRKGLSITKADLVEHGVPVINYGQIHSKANQGTGVVPSIVRYVPLKYVKSDNNALVNKGDFIFADTSEDISGCGNCAYIDSDGQIFAGYHSIIASGKLNSKYFAYLFLTDAWRSQIRSSVSGIKVYSISQTILANTSIIVPPVPEQHGIADFLDAKCAEIDDLIKLKQEKIETLKQYRQSLIFEAVTGKTLIS